MKSLLRMAAIVAAAGAIFAAPVEAGMPGADGNDTQIVMNPGQGLPLDVGGKRVVSYYTQEDKTCGLTMVLAESEMGGMANGGSEGPHGTRITTSVIPGKSVRIDGDFNRAAEFLCGPDGRKMNARIYTRDGYQAAEKKPAK